MRVFISYRRDHASWVARAVRQALEARGIGVFLDVEDIDAGRFENVIRGEIGRCDHFLVLLTKETARRLGAEGDWVTKELERAIELEKNVVPALVDEATAADVPDTVRGLRELNFLRLPHDLFDQAIDVLVQRYLAQPGLKEQYDRTAEEHYEAAVAAMRREDWAVAEVEYEKATTLWQRPEYFLGRSVAKHRLGRNAEALNDIDVAIALDPFAFELMKAKVDLLQQVDRLPDAINLMTTWRQQARARAYEFGTRVVARLDAGDDVVTAVRSVPQLAIPFWNLSEFDEVKGSLLSLHEFSEGALHDRIHAELDAWQSDARVEEAL